MLDPTLISHDSRYHLEGNAVLFGNADLSMPTPDEAAYLLGLLHIQFERTCFPVVLLLWHRSQMLGIHAASIVAFVMDIMALGYLALVMLVENAMYAPRLAVNVYKAISRLASGSLPHPTTVIIYFIERCVFVVLVAHDVSHRLTFDMATSAMRLLGNGRLLAASTLAVSIRYSFHMLSLRSGVEPLAVDAARAVFSSPSFYRKRVCIPMANTSVEVAIGNLS